MSETLHFPIVVVGAGGTGLCAALAARDCGAEVLVLERDPTPLGSTAMSTGLIPAAGTPDQAAAGIQDSPDRFAKDIFAKTGGKVDAAVVRRLTEESAETVAWLRYSHAVPLSLVDGFLYPGHSERRMYGTPNRSGGELMAALEFAVERSGAIILTGATVTTLDRSGDRVTGVQFTRPDGAVERVSCDAVILACSGFGGNPELVAKWIPEMAQAVFHGHPGNKGDALRWADELNAAVADMGAYQGHGGLAVGHCVPILWPLIMAGGFQVNVNGERFSNEAAGYSEQAAIVIAQPQRMAWSIFDERLHRLMMDFDDYHDALRAGAVIEAASVEELASRTGLPADQLSRTIAEVEQCAAGTCVDRFGRDFRGSPPLTAPYRASKVTGAIFHTQGGLVIDSDGRLLKPDGRPFPNLFAGGGAARGISGGGAAGYLAGNGLLTATTLGKLAGRAAAALVVG